MRYYFELFENLRNLYYDKIEDLDFYEGYFAELYDTFEVSENERNIYLNEAFQCGKEVLELCCGNGRMSVIMAENGFNVMGYDISEDMLEKFQHRKIKLPRSIQRRLNYQKADIFNLEYIHKYDVIILPATTICILADEESKLKMLLKKLYECLNPNGSFIFDYRTGLMDHKYKTELLTIADKNEESTSFTLIQEFINYKEGRAIGNFYTQTTDCKGVFRNYITSTNKKIIQDKFIQDILNECGFQIQNLHKVNVDNTMCNFVVAKRK